MSFCTQDLEKNSENPLENSTALKKSNEDFQRQVRKDSKQEMKEKPAAKYHEGTYNIK